MVALLLWAAVQDIKTREVDDIVWILMLALGIPFTGIRLLLYREDTSQLILIALSITAAFVLAFIILLSGLQGGADAKALFCISVVCPLSINSSASALEELIPLSITLFMNSILIMVPFPLVILAYNLVHPRNFNPPPIGPWWSHLLARFFGYPADLEVIKKKHPWHYDFIEQREDNVWEFIFRITLGDPENDLNRRKRTLAAAEMDGRTFLWIQPSLPFLVPMLVAFVISFLWGNLYFIILGQIFLN